MAGIKDGLKIVKAELTKSNAEQKLLDALVLSLANQLNEVLQTSMMLEQRLTKLKKNNL